MFLADKIFDSLIYHTWAQERYYVVWKHCIRCKSGQQQNVKYPCKRSGITVGTQLVYLSNGNSLRFHANYEVFSQISISIKSITSQSRFSDSPCMYCFLLSVFALHHHLTLWFRNSLFWLLLRVTVVVFERSNEALRQPHQPSIQIFNAGSFIEQNSNLACQRK